MKLVHVVETRNGKVEQILSRPAHAKGRVEAENLFRDFLEEFRDENGDPDDVAIEDAVVNKFFECGEITISMHDGVAL